MKKQSKKQTKKSTKAVKKETKKPATKKVVVISKPVETKPAVVVNKPAEVKPVKVKKPYKGTALAILTIFSLVIAAAVFVAGIVLVAIPEMQWAQEGATLIQYTGVYIWMIIIGFVGAVLSVLAIPARKHCTTFGLILALGILNIVLCASVIQIAVGVLLIVHANKVKKLNI